jgi:hypothetical protein
VAVTDGAWWSAWWEWMVWWLAALAGLATLAVFTVRGLMGRPRRHRVERSSLSPLYLDNDAVLDLYEFGNHAAALKKEVEERRSRSLGLTARLPFMSWISGKQDSSSEVFVKYLQEAKPISVIGMLLSVFEREDAIVHVHLRSGTLTPNRALLRELTGHGEDQGPAGSVVLSEVGEFAMVDGRFEEVAEDGGDTRVMRAVYGDGERSAHLRVVLRGNGLRTPDKRLPQGQFHARCLGKVTSWDPETRETILEHPIAVFR